MAKKPDPEEAGGARPDVRMADAVRDSAQQIWLAGMGAFAKAQQEGTKVFESLVQEGAGLQRRTQSATGERFGDVTGKISAMADEVSSRAGASWDKLESIFEGRTAKAMGRLGVPTAQDVQALSERVDALAAQVAKLTMLIPKPASRKAASTATRAGATLKRPVRRKAAKPDEA